MPFDPQHPQVRALLRLALEEDIGSGDVTSRLTIPEGRRATGKYRAKEPLVLAGVELLPLIFELHGGGEVQLQTLQASGARLQAGDVIAVASGPARMLLECERVSLNLLQRLSGIATLARQFADEVAHTNCKVLDTRKTTPGLRLLEKAAAVAGGATNHRIGLFDAVLIKNNHITAAGGVAQALQSTQGAGVPVEIEVRTREELDEALANGATHLLLDNLTPAEARTWIAHIDGRAKVELSGNITLATVRAYAETGADFVSSGSITHSARSVDINFRLEWE